MNLEAPRLQASCPPLLLGHQITMARSLLAVLLVALALGAQARQPLGIFDSIGEIASSAVGTVKDTATGAAGEGRRGQLAHGAHGSSSQALPRAPA